VNTSSQAVLLFVRGYEEDHKRFGLGPRADRALHDALLWQTLTRAQTLAHEAQLVIAYEGELPAMPHGTYLAQRGDGFGQRFRHALEDTFALGYERVVVIGGDIPQLTHHELRQALDHDDLTLGPAKDGGFYLAALRRADLQLFEDLPWRRSTLWSALQARLKAVGRSALTLAPLDDIDDARDARRHHALLHRLLRRWLARHAAQRPAPTSHQLPRNRAPRRRISALPPPAPTGSRHQRMRA
jgi:glycosyltransferase A (GT-A) superfamily protein (DUF2064 family)